MPIIETSSALVDALEAARDAEPTDDPARRLLAWTETFRAWSLATPCGFRLIYGDPVPGYQAPEGGPAPEAERRATLGLVELAGELGPPAGSASREDHERTEGSDRSRDGETSETRQGSVNRSSAEEPGALVDGLTWSDFDPGLVAAVRRQHPDRPLAAVAGALRIWARMHGLVSLEIYGHLGRQTHEADKLYRAEMHDLVRSLSLTPPRTSWASPPSPPTG